MRVWRFAVVVAALCTATAACSIVFPISDDAARGLADGGGGDIGPTGEAGVSDAPDAICTADLQFDPSNCGMCGRSCAGALCDHGRCQVEVLLTASSPTEIVVTRTDLFFATNVTSTYGQVAYCPLADCAKQQHGLTISGDPRALDVGAGNLIWPDGDGSLRWVSLTGLYDAGVHVLRTQSDLSAVGGAAFGADRYFIAETSGPSRIRTCSGDNLFSCGDGGSTLFATDPGAVRALVVDESSRRLFWWSDIAGGSILSCSVDGPCTSPSTVVSGEPDMGSFAVDGARVYWTRGIVGGAVLSAPASGPPGEPTVLATADVPWGIGVDGDHVYFTTLGSGIVPDAGTADGTVVRMAKAPGSPQLVLAAGLRRPWRVGFDDQFVYFANRGYYPAAATGSIARVPK